MAEAIVPYVLGARILTLSLLISLAATILFPAIGPRGKALALLSCTTLLLPGFAGLLAYYAYKSFSPSITDPTLAVIPQIGRITFFVDGASLPVLIGASFVGGIIALYSLPYMRERLEEMGLDESHLVKYYVLYQLFSASMIGVVLSNNIVIFYLFLELSLVTSFLLINWYGYGDRRRIAILYFVWTHVGAVFFLLGAIIYGLNAGTFDFYTAEGGLLLGYAEKIADTTLFKVALYTMLFGLLVKMAVLGVHFWLPYAHAEAPTPISALLSPVLIGLGGYGIFRIIFTLFGVLPSNLQQFLLFLALATILYGGFNALWERDLKRIFAYSSISQMGYVLLGISTLSSVGVAGSLLHILSHSYGKALLFMIAGVIIYLYHLRDVEKMGGMAHRIPYSAMAAMTGFLTIAGSPPTIGFWSEVLIVGGFVKAYPVLGASHFFALLALLIIGIGLTIAYSFITMKRVFFGTPSSELRARGEESENVYFKGTLLLITVLSMLFFIAFGYLAHESIKVTEIVLGGTR
uniref:NADH dehydrogenase n=1 Tax=Fervidicoccus fontis TaxID=683846 RepID=A0A7J3ZLX5_9CREN